MAGVITERITKTAGICGDKACVAGHRVRVMDIVIWHERMEMKADEIVSKVPTISLSDVYAALAYYFDHREEIREEIRLEHLYVSEFMKKNSSALRDKMKELLSGEDR